MRRMMRRRFGRGCGGGGFGPAFRGIRGGGNEPKGESALSGVGRPIGRLEAVVERFFGWRKGGFRRWTVRHERWLATFLAFVLLAGCLIDRRILR